jgi:hypothetical protein
MLVKRDLEFTVGDEVLLNVSPTKRIVCFGIKGSLAPDTLHLIGLQLELVP